MIINPETKELHLKIVYGGPNQSGKTDNLKHLTALIAPHKRSDLVTLSANNNRTIYFDLLQLDMGLVGSLQLKVYLYTMPEQLKEQESSRLVVQGIDGLIFVADSHPKQLRYNLQAWKDLQKYISSWHIDFNSLPIVIQLNKRDLPQAVSITVLHRVLETETYPTFEAEVINNKGIMEPLKTIINLILQKHNHPLTRSNGSVEQI